MRNKEYGEWYFSFVPRASAIIFARRIRHSVYGTTRDDVKSRPAHESKRINVINAARVRKNQYRFNGHRRVRTIL